MNGFEEDALKAHVWLMAALVLGMGGILLSHPGAQQPSAPDPLAARVDPHVDKPRVIVMTDIANEPDDQMSMVRFLVYSNQMDVEGLIATTSTWMKNKVRPDVIETLLGAYEQVLPNLLRHQPGFPSASSLRAVVVSGQPGYGMAAVGPDKMSPGAELIVRAAENPDPRPVWYRDGVGRTRSRRRCCRRGRRRRSPNSARLSPASRLHHL